MAKQEGTAGVASAIAIAYTDRVAVRGQDLCRDLIGRLSFTEYFLVLLGLEPNAKMVRMLDATLVAIAEHGMVPSVQAARMTLSAAPTALQGAVAAGLLGCGEVILGAAELAGRLLIEIDSATKSGTTLDTAVTNCLTELRQNRKPLPGFGHPLHKPEDPRAWRLLECAQENGTAGRYVTTLKSVHAQLAAAYGRKLPLNVSGAIPAVLLDVGFPIEAMKGVPLVARAAGLVAHLLEEQRRAIGFKLADAASASVTYDGPPLPGLQKAG